MLAVSIRYSNGDVKETGGYASQSSRKQSELKTKIWKPLAKGGFKDMSLNDVARVGGENTRTKTSNVRKFGKWRNVSKIYRFLSSCENGIMWQL